MENQLNPSRVCGGLRRSVQVCVFCQVSSPPPPSPSPLLHPTASGRQIPACHVGGGCDTDQSWWRELYPCLFTWSGGGGGGVSWLLSVTLKLAVASSQWTRLLQAGAAQPSHVGVCAAAWLRLGWGGHHTASVSALAACPDAYDASNEATQPLHTTFRL